ncbi:hypothetical protein [Variovorax boronicumulans]|uniref:hypothetical protein n=1 Tax=Variovorax boronicumulans TaxID=436515 RepID=UPI00278219D7|nr:Flp pilus assembly protein TadB [Variovorax boronicumulans]
MTMVEEEQAHRISHDNKRQAGEIAAAKRGHLLGGAITVIAILAAVVGAYLGVHPVVCVAIVGLPIASILKSIFGKG